MLQIVFMAAVAGIAALQLGEKAQPILTLSESVLELLQKALWWVIRLALIGTAGLIGNAIATYGWDLIGKYATFTADIYVGCLIVLFGVYPALLATVAKVGPVQFFKGAWPHDPAGLRLPLLGRHHAADPEGHRAPGRAEGVRELRRAVRRDHEDGRLRRDLPGHRRDLRRADLRRPARRRRLPADRVRLGGGLRRHGQASPAPRSC